MNQRILDYNRSAWDHQVQKKNRWTVPVTSEQINHARKGDWSLVLTPTKPVPGGWFPDLENCKVLCLASGGGQQGPILSAAGADVTVFDNSPQQLAQDQMVANRDELNDQSELREIELRVNRGNQWWSKSKGKIYAPKTAPKELRETANSLGKTLLGDFSLQSVRDLETSYGPLLVFRGGNSAWKFRTHLFQSGELYRMKMEARLQPEKLGHHSRGNPSIS